MWVGSIDAFSSPELVPSLVGLACFGVIIATQSSTREPVVPEVIFLLALGVGLCCVIVLFAMGMLRAVRRLRNGYWDSLE